MGHVTLLQYDALAFHLPASNAPRLGVVQDRAFLAFDDATPQHAKTRHVRMPGQYGGGTLKATITYFMASATSGTVDFEVSVEAIGEADAVDLDAGESFDSANAASATVPATAGHVAMLTITLTNKDDVEAGDTVRFKLQRDADDAANDTAVGDARVVGLEIWEETP